MNMFPVWNRMKLTAVIADERDYVISVADAKVIVADICWEEHKEYPPPEALEYLATELVRLTLEAREFYESRVPTRPSYRDEILPERRDSSPLSIR